MPKVKGLPKAEQVISFAGEEQLIVPKPVSSTSWDGFVKADGGVGGSIGEGGIRKPIDDREILLPPDDGGGIGITPIDKPIDIPIDKPIDKPPIDIPPIDKPPVDSGDVKPPLEPDVPIYTPRDAPSLPPTPTPTPTPKPTPVVVATAPMPSATVLASSPIFAPTFGSGGFGSAPSGGKEPQKSKNNLWLLIAIGVAIYLIAKNRK